jgi:hypothetical protein
VSLEILAQKRREKEPKFLDSPSFSVSGGVHLRHGLLFPPWSEASMQRSDSKPHAEGRRLRAHAGRGCATRRRHIAKDGPGRRGCANVSCPVGTGRADESRRRCRAQRGEGELSRLTGTSDVDEERRRRGRGIVWPGHHRRGELGVEGGVAVAKEGLGGESKERREEKWR